MEKEFIKKIASIQSMLKAPKNQYNSFGKYKYRSCEDILEAVKPYLKENDLVLFISDDIVQIGDRFYVKSTATLTDGENTINNIAFAREVETKAGQDGSQITGASSSYARKYALNGLFCIDDNKDSDATNDGNSDSLEMALQEVRAAQSEDTLRQIWANYSFLQKESRFVNEIRNVRQKLTAKK